MMFRNLRMVSLLTVFVSYDLTYSAPVSKQLSSTQTQDAIRSMNPDRIVELASTGKLGECKSFSNVGKVSHLYSLKWANNGSEHFGIRLIPAARNFVVNRNLTSSFLQQAALALPNPETTIAPHSLAGITEDPKVALANKIKTLVQENKCGSINFTTSQVNFKSLSSDKVKFYRDEAQKLVCSSEGFENEIRDPATCQMRPVTTFLPDKVCRFLYQVARAKGNVDVGVKKTGLTRINVMPTVKLEPFTAEIKKMRNIDLIFKDRSHLSAIETLQSSRVPPAELYLPANITERLKDPTLELNKFETLPTSVKNELSEFVVNYEATKNKSGLPEWSSEFTQVYQNIKPNVELHLQTNPDISVGLYNFPTNDAVVSSINDRILPFIRAGLPRFTYDACRLPTRIPPLKFNPNILMAQDVQVTSSLLQNLYLAKFDNLKIDQAIINSRINNLPINLVRPDALMNIQTNVNRSVSGNPNTNSNFAPTVNPNPTNNNVPTTGPAQELNFDDFDF